MVGLGKKQRQSFVTDPLSCYTAHLSTLWPCMHCADEVKKVQLSLVQRTKKEGKKHAYSFSAYWATPLRLHQV